MMLTAGKLRRMPNEDPAAVHLMAAFGLQPTKVLLIWPCGSATGWSMTGWLPKALACSHYQRSRRRWTARQDAP
jgi:hypothetical protein